MRVEVDLSGKIHRIGEANVLAFSNTVKFAIRISGREKKKLMDKLKRRRPNAERSRLNILIFATLLYFLLKKHIDQLIFVKVDIEFEGHDSFIREHLRNLFARRGIDLPSERLAFGRIGKKSGAHKIAWRVYKRLAKPDKELTAKEVLAEF